MQLTGDNWLSASAGMRQLAHQHKFMRCRTLCAIQAVPQAFDAFVQVTEFQVVASEFLQRLKTTGPGLPNTDLAKGLELLKKFQVCHILFVLSHDHCRPTHIEVGTRDKVPGLQHQYDNSESVVLRYRKRLHLSASSENSWCWQRSCLAWTSPATLTWSR